MDYALTLFLLLSTIYRGGVIQGGSISNVRTASGGSTCTVGPLTSATTIASISTTINSQSSSGGAVICLQRGQTWNVTVGLNLTANFPDGNRVTICAADPGGTTCTDSGLAKPIIHDTANGTAINNCNATTICFGPTSGGYYIKNIDFSGPDADNNLGLVAERGSKNVTFDNTHFSHFSRWGYADRSGTANTPIDNYRFGVCTSGPGCADSCTRQVELSDQFHFTGDEWQILGSFNNTTFSMNIHDMHQDASRDHILDLEASSQTEGGSSHSIVVECTKFNGSTGGGAIIDASYGHDLTVRDNVVTGCSGNGPWVGFDSHGPDGRNWFWTGGDVYRNKLDYSSCTAGEPVVVQVGQQIKVHDNIMYAQVNSSGNERGLVQFWCRPDADTTDQVGSDIQIYNNTVFRTGSTSVGAGWPIFGGNGSCVTGPMPTNISMVNNLIIENDSVDGAKPWKLTHQTCSDFGTNASQVHHNFEYASGIAPTFPSCSADDDWIQGGLTAGDDGTIGTSGETGSAPGLAGDGSSYTGDLATAFTPSAGSSKVCGRGDSTYCSLSGTDFNGNPRTSCDIGAIVCP